MLKNISLFVHAAEMQSFTRVAKEFALGQPAVSKAIRVLEEELKVKLFHRNSRVLKLTEAGEQIYRDSLALLECYEKLLAHGQGEKTSIRGEVNLSVPVALGTLNLIPGLQPLLQQYPGLIVNLKLSDTFSDLMSEGIDVVIRVGELKDSRLKSKAVGYIQREVVATRDYIQRFGMPEKPEDLQHHNCLVQGGSAARRMWVFTKRGRKFSVPIGGNLIIDSLIGIRSAVLAGLGIGYVGGILFSDPDLRKNVVTLFDDYQTEALPINILYAHDKFIPKRVRVLIDYLHDTLCQQPWIN